MRVFTGLFLLLASVVAADEPGALVLSGRVLDAEGKPVAGGEVMASALGSPPVLVAWGKVDDSGKFRLSVPPERDAARVNLPLVVWGFRPGAGVGGTVVSRQSPPKEGELTVKLRPANGLEVVVSGPDGAAVAGAVVAPRIVRVEGGRSTSSPHVPPTHLTDRLAARTDEKGRARLPELDPAAVQALDVKSPLFGHQAAQSLAGEGGVVAVRLAAVCRVRGRVAAATPGSTAGLTVTARTRPDAPGPGKAMGEARVVTDASGRFEIPAIAAGRLAVNVQLPTDSVLSPKLPAERKVEPGATAELEIPLEGPVRLRTLAGRVVDRRGEPVAGAVVFQVGDTLARTHAETDARGAFRLEGVAETPTFVFARAGGFRFQGRAVGPKDDDLALTVARDDEPADAPSATLASALSRAEEVALARRVLDPYAARVLKDGGESDRIPVILALARIEPGRVLEMIEGRAFTDPFMVAMMRMQVAAGLRVDAPDEALAVIDAIDDPASRAMGLAAASDALPSAEGAKKRELLARATVDARGAKDPAFRLLMTSMVAEHWLDLGETERGTALLRECHADAEKMAKAAFAGYARGAYAEELAQVDLKGALALIADLADPREFDRHHGNIAHELAGRDPEQAERVLGMVRDAFQRDQYAVRVAYRMPRVDVARARRLARSIHDASLRGHALGMVALALAESDRRDDAAATLAEALDALEKAAEEGGVRKSTLYSPAATATTLIPIAERIDPRLVAPTFWRAVSLRAPRPLHRNGGPDISGDLELAAGIARYDRAMARALIDRYVGPEAPVLHRLGIGGRPYAVAAAIDPAWAVSLVEALPDDPDAKLEHPRNGARLAVANVLARRGEARWRYLTSHHLNLWVPDVEDNDPDL